MQPVLVQLIGTTDDDATRWKLRYLRQRAARRKAQLTLKSTLTPVPTQIDVRQQQTADLLNVAVYSMTRLYDVTARLRGCAEEAIGLFLSKHNNFVFAEPIPLTLTTLALVWFQGYMPGQVAVADFSADLHLPDPQLIVSMVNSLELRLGVST